MKKAILLIFVVSLFLCTGSMNAQVVAKSSDLSPYVGIMKFDGGDTELMFGARYNYNVDVNSSIEATIGLIFPDAGKIYLYHANYRYNITLNNPLVVPFVTGGVGAVTRSPDNGDSQTDLSINFGGGLQYFTSENLAVRIDVRDHMVMAGDTETTYDIPGGGTETQTVKGETTNNLEFSGGITYFFI